MLVAAPAAAADKIKASIPVTTGTYAMYYVAQDRGYFGEEDLDVELIVAGGGVATPALMAGDLDFNGSPGAAISAILRGAPIKIFFVSQDRPAYELWSGDPKIVAVADLKGKPVGVFTRGDTTEVALRILLKTQGMDANSVIYTALNQGQVRLAALTANSVSAAMLLKDEGDQAKSLPNLHLVADVQQSVKQMGGGAVARNAAFAEGRDTTRRFLRALIKARRYTDAFRAETLDSLQTRNPRTPRAALEASYDDTVKTATKDGALDPEAQQGEIDARSDVLNIPPAQRMKPAQVFDFSLVAEVNRELDAKGWTPRR
jgi:ABC-type nitrate/sulfonate/bicarbonate transport system substrate-binding protein